MLLLIALRVRLDGFDACWGEWWF